MRPGARRRRGRPLRSVDPHAGRRHVISATCGGASTSPGGGATDAAAEHHVESPCNLTIALVGGVLVGKRGGSGGEPEARHQLLRRRARRRGQGGARELVRPDRRQADRPDGSAEGLAQLARTERRPRRCRTRARRGSPERSAPGGRSARRRRWPAASPCAARHRSWVAGHPPNADVADRSLDAELAGRQAVPGLRPVLPRRPRAGRRLGHRVVGRSSARPRARWHRRDRQFPRRRAILVVTLRVARPDAGRARRRKTDRQGRADRGQER